MSRRRDRWACAYRTHVAEYARARARALCAPASFRVGEEPEESVARWS